MSIEDEISEDSFGDEDDDFDKELDQEVIMDLAMDYIWGEVTDDNPSNENGLSGLEQVIAYAFDLGQDDKEAIKKFKYRVFARVSELNGGCDMSDSEFFSLQD